MASRKKPTHFSEEPVSEIVKESNQEFSQELVDLQFEETTIEVEEELKIENTEVAHPVPEKAPVVEKQIVENSFVPPAKLIRNPRNIPRFSRLRDKSV